MRRIAAARAAFVTDIAATALFAVEGAVQGANAGLDVLGVLVVGFCTALVGGILRDVLLGALPPAAVGSPSRIVVALSGALLAFIVLAAGGQVAAEQLVVLDALALGLFAVTGAELAIRHRCNPIVVVILGTITAVGGGVVRDLLLGRVPVVLSESVYAGAAVIGIVSMLLCRRFRVGPAVAMSIGAVVCAAVRLLAVALDWNLPTLTS